MESKFLEQNEIILDTLDQIRVLISNLKIWNQDVHSMNELLLSPTGMQALAGNCMAIMAIGEGFKKIDKITDGKLLPLRNEIPWHQVFGLRNRIAHGYFDIDVEIIEEVIKSDLDPLLDATDFFIANVSSLESKF